MEVAEGVRLKESAQHARVGHQLVHRQHEGGETCCCGDQTPHSGMSVSQARHFFFFFTVGRYRIYRVSTRWHYEPNGRLYIEFGVTNKNDMHVQHLREHNDLILLRAGNAYPLPLNL